MKIKTSELQGPALDWAVAKCEGFLCDYEYNGGLSPYSTDWAQGGPIIERERIELEYWHHSFDGQQWRARKSDGCRYSDIDGEFIEDSDTPRFGPTPLIAAMRCYVASKLGDEVEIPEELK